MKKIFTLLSALCLTALSFGQVVFQSDLSSWNTGDPTDWMGTKTSIASASVTQVTIGATHGTSMASLVEQTSSHKRFTTQTVAVTAGETYEIKMWVRGAAGEIRTAFFDLTDNTTGPFGNGYSAYNGWNDLTTLSAGNLVEIAQVVTIPAASVSAEFIISIRNTDAAGILVDSVSVEVTAPPAITPIYDIQYTANANGESPELGNLVKTKGVVTGVYLFGSAAGSFFIQDGDGPWNGIYVFATGYVVNIGDSVTVTGTIDEYLSGTEKVTEFVSVTEVTILNSGNALPTPANVTSTSIITEQYEGVLVKLEYVKCTSAANAFGVWTAKDNVGPNIDVDDNLLPAQFNPVLGDGYDITGIKHYAFSKHLLLPTDASDIVTVGWAGLESNSTEFSIYPNPATDNVTINAAANSHVAIYSVTGALVYTANGTTSVDVSNFEAGIYQITVSTENETSTQKLVVR